MRNSPTFYSYIHFNHITDLSVLKWWGHFQLSLFLFKSKTVSSKTMHFASKMTISPSFHLNLVSCDLLCSVSLLVLWVVTPTDERPIN